MGIRLLDQVNTLEFKQNGDDRGHLVVVEGNKDIPFALARIFYIYGSDTDVVRGRHANRRSEFVLVNVNGSSKVKVSDGREEKIIVLDKPYRGVYLPKMLWKEMYDFSKDSVLLCLASEAYDPNEYIRNYSDYVKEMRVIHE